MHKEQIPKSWNLKFARLGEWDRTVNPDCQEIFGNYYCARDPEDHEVEATFTHELYDSSSADKFNDIAVLRLETPVVFSDFIRPICILDFNGGLDDRPATVIGYGKTETSTSSDRLQSVEIDIVAPAVCSRKYSTLGRRIVKSQICAYKKDADTW